MQLTVDEVLALHDDTMSELMEAIAFCRHKLSIGVNPQLALDELANDIESTMASVNHTLYAAYHDTLI